MKWRRFFNFLAAQQGKSEMMVLEQKLELEQLKVCSNKFALVPPSLGSALCLCNEQIKFVIVNFNIFIVGKFG